MGFLFRNLEEPAVEPELAIEWEETNCLLCGSRHWTHVIEAADNSAENGGLWFAVVQCRECGLCFTNPRPARSSIGQFYPESYQPHRTPTARQHSRKTPAQNPASWHGFHRLKPCVERRTLPWHGKGRLLDFGCGGGSYLLRMHRQGWQVTGLDMSAKTVQRIRDELGLHALVGTLPHPQLQPESFDVITMWQSLEHVHEPMEVLREAHRLLAPGGKLIVATPNIDSLPFRWFGNAWHGLDLPRHLTHFTPRTMTQMLLRAGFRVGPIRMLRHSTWLRSSAKLACRSRRRSYWKPWLQNKPLSRLVAWYTYLTGQSDGLLATAEK